MRTLVITYGAVALLGGSFFCGGWVVLGVGC